MADLTSSLIDQVRHTAEENQPVVIRAGGSKDFMGRATGEVLPVIDISGHSGIVSYQPVELVITVRAGTSLSVLEAALSEQGQVLAFEPPRFSEASTIGGTLACNQSGPARPWAGSVRDHVLGVSMINGNGEHLRFGGQVMKNVAGFDVSRLQAGALGTLGIMTEISLKVLPKPACTLTVSWELPAGDALTMMNSLAGQPKPVSAACWYQGTLYVRLSGAGTAVEATAAQWRKLGGRICEAEAFWQSLRDCTLKEMTGEPIWRLSVNSEKPLPTDTESIIDWGGAQRWLSGKYDAETLQASAHTANGQATKFKGGGRQDDVFHPVPLPLQHIHKRIKAAFDPKGIFNPGRSYSWL
ncbi:glycolate oxidase subunit GlcE [Parasalinivibrio latis]|uniref:glycolate oxidase subunit GlcE n=1 Tax=Parasalinivibrio latis TaxID=2952610 RepID=UPI0030DF5144